MIGALGRVLMLAADGGEAADRASSFGTTALTVAGSIVVAFIGLGTAYLGIRASRQQKRVETKNEAAKTELEQSRLHIEERKQRDEYYDKLTENMQSRIEQMTVHNGLMQSRVEGLQAQIDQLNVERSKDRTVIDVLVSYCRQLISLLHHAGIEPPITPEEIAAYGIYHPDHD